MDELPEDVKDQITEIVDGAIDNTPQPEKEPISSAAELAEGAIALAEQQTAMAQLDAAQRMQTYETNLNELREKMQWMTTQLESMNSTQETLQTLSLQVDELLSTQKPSEPIAEIQEPIAVLPEAPETLEKSADESPEAKTEPKRRRSVNRI